ncbi:MAG: T9SS type A sorting domain-containing protein [Cyclobacteriaceae bacterium]
MSPGDPNLDPNWDWTINGTGYTIYYDAPNITNPVQLNNIQLPFYTQGNSLNTYEKDMHPEDGWVLMYRDFGTPTSAPPFPFFVLYNKYRGIFRLMIYNSQNLSSTYYRINLSFWDGQKAGALFTFQDDTKAFLDDYESSEQQISMGTMAEYEDWAVADFIMFGFDPNLHPDARLNMYMYKVDESQINLASTSFTLNQIMKDAAPTSNFTNGTQTLIDAINNGHKYYGEVTDVKKALQDKSDAASGNPWWKSVVDGFLSSSVSTVAPWVGGLMGLVTSYMGFKSEQSAKEPLKFEGAIEMSGTISQQLPSYNRSFALSTGSTNAGYYTPLQNIDIGVFNLNSKPIVHKDYDITYVYNDYYQECEVETEITYTLDKLTFNYTLNSNSGMTLSDVDIAFTYDNSAPSAYRDFATESVSTNAFNTQYSTGAQPTGLAVKLTLQITAPTMHSDDELIVYKIYLFDGQDRHTTVGQCTGYRLGGITEDPDFQIFPNPVRSTKARFKYSIINEGNYKLKVYDLSDKEEATIVNTYHKAGEYKIDWNEVNLSSGMYIYTLEGPNSTQTGKFIKQ